MMNSRIFREYDIRGVADRDLTEGVMHALGQSFATLIRQRAGGRLPRPLVACGRDCRISSPHLAAAFMAGVADSGADVINIGTVPSPVLYFAPATWDLDGAVIITGSHNPPGDNGLKLLCKTTSLYGDDIQVLRRMAETRTFFTPPAHERGTITDRDVTPRYLDHVASSLRLGARRFKVVVDAGNGAGGPTAVALYERLGFDIIPLYCDMDGRFPNHHPDPTVAENLAHLRERVMAEGAEVGIAFDGDADRIGVVDRQGRILWGDQLMILFGREILRELPGATFIAEVKCSQALYDELRKAGGNPIMWKVGHSLIKAKMKEIGAALGGEMSGHLFFAHRYLGFDDGIYAGARLLEILSRSPATLADLYDTLPVMVNTPEIRIDCPDELKFEVVRRVTMRLRSRPDVRDVVDIDGARVNFGNGWGLIRASNTQPVLVMRCEADTIENLDMIRHTIAAEVAAVRLELSAQEGHGKPSELQ